MSGPVVRKVRSFVIVSLRSSEIRRQIRAGLKEIIKFSRIDNKCAILVVAPPFLNFRSSWRGSAHDLTALLLDSILRYSFSKWLDVPRSRFLQSGVRTTELEFFNQIWAGNWDSERHFLHKSCIFFKGLLSYVTSETQ